MLSQLSDESTTITLFTVDRKIIEWFFIIKVCLDYLFVCFQYDITYSNPTTCSSQKGNKKTGGEKACVCADLLPKTT